MPIEVPPPAEKPSGDAHGELPWWHAAVNGTSDSPYLLHLDNLFPRGGSFDDVLALLDRIFAKLPAAATTVPIPSDVALFYRLVDTCNKMWNDAGRYGEAGLKIRRGLIAFLVLFFFAFMLDVAVAQAHLTSQQVADITLVEGALAVAVAVAKK